MTMRVFALAMHDVRLQCRYGIYAAYGVIIGLYVAMLLSAGPALPDWTVPTIVFVDPAALGFFFLGALMMLERGEGVRVALATTPISAADYLGAKVLTLTVMALIASLVLLAFSASASGASLMALSVVLTSVQYVGIGAAIALRFRTVGGYLIGSAIFLTPVIAPAFLAFLEPFPLGLSVIPAVSQLRLMLVASNAASARPDELIVMILVCCLAAIGALWLALRALRREFGR